MSIESRLKKIEQALNPLGDNPNIVVIVDDIGEPVAPEEIEVARQQAIREGRPVCIVEGRKDE